MDYPIWNLAFGGGVLIGIVAITHVLVSHFAIGGGFAIAFVETLAVRRRDPALRGLAKRSSLMLILVSTVFGAISGVGIWVTIGLVQPAATSALIHNYVWGWAAEWGFFILEVATALAYYATWDKVRPRTHLLIIWLYFFAAYMSLVIIQGIISFMLTPGRWLETRSFWDGDLQSDYLPGLLLRTGICLFLAGAYLTLAALREPDGARARAHGAPAGGLPGRGRAARLRRLPLVGARAAGVRDGDLPREQGPPARPGLDPPLRPLGADGLPLLALFALAACPASTGGRRRWSPCSPRSLSSARYERLREGVRKPFVIRDFMFSNGMLVSEIADLNQRGILSQGRLGGARERRAPEGKGVAVFRAQCASCHTLDGYLSIRKLVAARRSGHAQRHPRNDAGGGERVRLRAVHPQRGTWPPRSSTTR